MLAVCIKKLNYTQDMHILVSTVRDFASLSWIRQSEEEVCEIFVRFIVDVQDLNYAIEDRKAPTPEINLTDEGKIVYTRSNVRRTSKLDVSTKAGPNRSVSPISMSKSPSKIFIETSSPFSSSKNSSIQQELSPSNYQSLSPLFTNRSIKDFKSSDLDTPRARKFDLPRNSFK